MTKWKELLELQKQACGGTLGACDGGAWAKWKEAGYYAFKNHAGYSAAFKANKTAKELFDQIQDKAAEVIDILAADPETDPSWYDPKDPSSPVGIRDHAYWALGVLGDAKQALIADLAAHFTIHFADAAANPEAAAADADAAAKAQPIGYHPGTRPNPNAEDPNNQSNKHPKEDIPPEGDEGLPWYVYAGAAALIAAVVKVLS